MKAYERLIKYAAVYTASEEGVERSPSTERQFALAHMLVGELRGLGVRDAECSESCYVYAHLPATPGCEGAPRLGFIAHMDTAPDFCGEGVKPRVIENYDGGEVELGCGRTLSPDAFPHLRGLAGRTLITASGDTLLGADDKAGVAEIMTLVEELLASGAAHGPLSICFTPDEEVGRGTAAFDAARFAADFAYTVDGGAENEFSCENFNAASAVVRISGVNVHPGDAKDVMVNAALLAMEFNSLLPGAETPRGTSGREGFYHLTDINACCESSVSRYILRDHDAAMLEARKRTMLHAAAALNEKYGPGTVSVEITDGYRNMYETICPEHSHLVDSALAAIRAAGMEPDVTPVRGGTDGAVLSWQGLPCPNLGTGGWCFHGPYEHITAEGMDSVVAVLRGLTEIYSRK